MNKKFAGYTTLYVLSFMTISYLSARLYHTLFDVNNCICIITPLFSDQTKISIQRYLHNGDLYKKKSAPVLCAQLQQAFACIDTIDCVYLPSGNVRITIEGVSPAFTVNKDYVLAGSGKLLASSCFASDTLQHLKAIQVTELFTCMAPTIKKSLDALPEKAFDSYTICWINEIEARLQDKQHKMFSIVFNAQVIPDASVLEQCQQIKNEIMNKQGRASSNKKLVADVRFKDQIVLSSGSGGTVHG